MNTKITPGWVATALFSLAAIFFSCLSYADSSKAKASGAQDADTANQVKIEKKLGKILENEEALLQGQQALSQKLDAIMEELRIIKVRSTH